MAHRVIQQVGHHAFNHRHIGVYHRQRPRHVNMQIDLARAGRELKLLRHVGNQLRHCEPLALGFNTAVFKARQLKKLLRKMPDFLPLTQRGGEILLVLLRRQGGGFERQGFEIAQQ